MFPVDILSFLLASSLIRKRLFSPSCTYAPPMVSTLMGVKGWAVMEPLFMLGGGAGGKEKGRERKKGNGTVARIHMYRYIAKETHLKECEIF